MRLDYHNVIGWYIGCPTVRVGKSPKDAECQCGTNVNDAALLDGQYVRLVMDVKVA